MLQGTNRQSLPWVRKTHPHHEAAVPEVCVMGDLFPTSPEAADGAVAQDCDAKCQHLFSREVAGVSDVAR